MCIVCVLWFFDLHTVENYAWAWSLSVIFAVVLSVVIVVSKYHSYFVFSGWKFDKSEYVRVFKYAFWVMLSANVGMLLSQIDMQMVIYML
jgi:O-antigen/teichoic acid export membrane protein